MITMASSHARVVFTRTLVILHAELFVVVVNPVTLQVQQGIHLSQYTYVNPIHST